MSRTLVKDKKGTFPGKVLGSTFYCDHPGCTEYRTEQEIIRSGGMTKMGWQWAAPKHYCAAHNRKVANG